MFGYVRPVFSQLSKEEKDRYQSAYCGLCHTMGKHYGWIARFTLNYDFTLLALLHYGCSGSAEVQCCRCPAHPLRKPKQCLCGESLDAAAAQSMILTWHKLSDDINDRGFLGGLPARLLRALFRRGYRRAVQMQSRFDSKVAIEMERLREFEEMHSPKLDRVADTFAAILSAAAEEYADEKCHRVMSQLFYHLGRWIYLVDAWDDLDSDQKRGRYNPLNARFCGNAKSEQAYVETTISHSARLIQSAAALLDFGEWKPVIENILCIGIPTVQRAVFDGQWKELQKQGRRRHERPV